MYPVSNAFLTAVKANTRKYYWTGKITTTANRVCPGFVAVLVAR